jgi:thiol-disulfide isomerase/thioredoxin
MKNTIKFIIILLFLTLFLSAKTRTASASPVEIFPPAKDMYLRSVTGNSLWLNKDLEGKPVIIIFWASWCNPCIEQIQEISKVRNRIPEFEILSIALVDSFYDPKIVSDGISLPIYYGNKNIASLYKVWGMPTVYILDREHRIREKFSGYVNIKKILAATKKIK